MSDRTNSTSPRVRKHIVGSCKGILNRGANGVSSFIGLSVSGGLMGGLMVSVHLSALRLEK